MVEEILRHIGKWGAKRERGPPEQRECDWEA